MALPQIPECDVSQDGDLLRLRHRATGDVATARPGPNVDIQASILRILASHQASA